jgi:nucleoside-diphosphate-sugar epimerase
MGQRAIVVTGASGLVGGLLAATLLQRETCQIVLPLRQKNDPELVRQAILVEAFGADRQAAEAAGQRLVTVPLPRTADFSAQLVPELMASLAGFEVTDLVHSAGCLNYFNLARLREGNQELTTQLLEVARHGGGSRFIYISTAFASGYRQGPIEERLHDPPAQDPNEYTRSKRETEFLVARSGLPHLIVRPSIVVGHSQDGRYRGKPYGAYQLWTGLCRFLCDRHRPVIHGVAPRLPLNLVHQDALQEAFHAAFHHLEDGAIMHVVSDDTRVPTARQYWDLWMQACGRPDEVRYHERLEDVPLEQIDPAQRLLLEFVEANIEISTHRWAFTTGHLERLRRQHGLVFCDATVATMERCLETFLAGNPQAQRFMAARGQLQSAPASREALAEVA